MRFVPILLLSALLSNASHAATGDKPPAWHGVWRGTIGKLDVMACLSDQAGQPAGAYYYQRFRNPILFASANDKQGGTLVLSEPLGKDERAAAPAWNLSKPKAGLMTGTWTGNGQQYPIKLVHIALTRADSEHGPCASDAFNAPIEKSGRVVATRAQNSSPYQALALDFEGRSAGNLNSIALTGSGKAIEQVNAALREQLLAEQRALFACARAALASGRSGDYNSSTTPTLLTPRWLVTESHSNSLCADTRPRYESRYQTWNLETGREVNVWTWFNPSAVGVSMARDSDGQPYQRVELRQRLDELLTRQWKRSASAECRETVGDEEIQWQLYPTIGGMAFIPSLEWAARSCEQPMHIPLNRLAPLLTKQGQTHLAAIQKARQK